MNYKLRHTRKIVMLFIIIPAVVLIMTVVFIILNQRLLEKRYHYFCALENAIGISTQTPILYKGFEIGRVHKFGLTDDGNILVDFFILKSYHHIIHANSVIYRTTNPITGKSTLEYVSDKVAHEPLAEGAKILSTDFAEGRSLLKKYLPKASDPIAAIIENLELLTRELNNDHNEDKGALMRILVSLADFTEHANQSLDLLDQNLSETHRLIANINQDHNPDSGVLLRALNNLADSSESLNAQMETVKSLLESSEELVRNYADPESLLIRVLDPTGEQIFYPLSQTLYSLSAATADLQQMMSSFLMANPEMLLMINHLNENLEKSSKTLEAINNNPLLRKAIPPSKIRAYAPSGRYHALPDD